MSSQLPPPPLPERLTAQLPEPLDTFVAVLRRVQQKQGSRTGATRMAEVDDAEAVE